MKVPIKGIVHVTGESDTGKTTFALQCGAKVSRICFLDADIKGAAIAKNIPFGMYRDLVMETKGMKEIEIHEHCLAILQRIEPNQYDVIVWDDFSLFEKTFQPYVAKYPTKFKDRYSAKGQIKGAEIWLASFSYESQVLAYMATLADLVVIISHLKNHNINGKRTGKLVPDIKRPLIRKSSMRLWLRHNPNSAVPIGLVLKRPGRDVVLGDGTYGKINVLPRRIVPNEDDEGLWDVITRYWDEPMDLRKPLPHEYPNDFELSILDGTLTDDQKIIFKTGKVKEEDMLDFSDEREDKVRELRGEGMSVPKIARQLEISRERVMRALENE